MGGQACVFYGAAGFSRATDFAILADAENLARLERALAELRLASSRYRPSQWNISNVGTPPISVANIRKRPGSEWT